MSGLSTIVRVSDASAVAEARRTAVNCADQAGFDKAGLDSVALVATELATNLLKHAQVGELLMLFDAESRATLDILSIDRGPGISSLPRALQDGFSTVGSQGTGLGAVKRLAAEFDVHSGDDGTVMLCRMSRDPIVPRSTPIAGICVAKGGETSCGDAWGTVRSGSCVTIVIADGLGHGSSAAEASTKAVGKMREWPERSVQAMIEGMNDPLRSTRGAAVMAIQINAGERKIEVCGIGNIAGSVVGLDATRQVVSLNGIVGHEMRKVQTFSYPWSADSILVMQSDGIGTNWRLNHYPGLVGRDPAVIAGVIFRDFCRGSDDATVVVAKPW